MKRGLDAVFDLIEQGHDDQAMVYVIGVKAEECQHPTWQANGSYCSGCRCQRCTDGHAEYNRVNSWKHRRRTR